MARARRSRSITEGPGEHRQRDVVGEGASMGALEIKQPATLPSCQRTLSRKRIAVTSPLGRSARRCAWTRQRLAQRLRPARARPGRSSRHPRAARHQIVRPEAPPPSELPAPGRRGACARARPRRACGPRASPPTGRACAPRTQGKIAAGLPRRGEPSCRRQARTGDGVGTPPPARCCKRSLRLGARELLLLVDPQEKRPWPSRARSSC